MCWLHVLGVWLTSCCSQGLQGAQPASWLRLGCPAAVLRVQLNRLPAEHLPLPAASGNRMAGVQEVLHREFYFSISGKRGTAMLDCTLHQMLPTPPHHSAQK
jgi:hypothetical protein